MEGRLWREWFEKEAGKLKSTNPLRPAKRRYLHFDNRITILDEAITGAMLAPDKVAQHSFYPFIRIDTREVRFRRPKKIPRGDRRRERAIKRRPIDFAAHKDALVYSWYGALLSTYYERELAKRGIGEHIIAYRSFKSSPSDVGKNNANFAKDAFDFINSHAPCHVIALDILKFYEEIVHDFLKTKWAQLLGISTLPLDHFNVYKSLANYHFVRKGRIRIQIEKATRQWLSRIFSTDEYKKQIIRRHLQEKGRVGKGIPQGAPISCVLANIYMIDFDTAIASAVTSLGGFYRRYSDDILVACPPGHSKEIVKIIMTEIKKLDLEIKDSKTERRHWVENDGQIQSLDPITHAVSSFQYLGIVTDGINIRLRHGSLARFERRRNRTTRKSVISALQKDRGGAPKNYLHKKFGVANNNFLAYAKRAAAVLNAPNIPRQASVTREARRLRKKIDKISKAFGGFKNT